MLTELRLLDQTKSEGLPGSQLFAARLEGRWTDATNDAPNKYAIVLTNCSSHVLKDFSLCFNAPCRVDAAATVVGGVVTKLLSNHTTIKPPEKFILAPGASWKVEIQNMHWRLHHWSDGVRAAYLAFDDGTTARVQIAPTQNVNNNVPPRRGTKRLAIPVGVEEPISVVPWPNEVNISGRRATPQGFDFQADCEGAPSFAEFFSTDFTRAALPAPR